MSSESNSISALIKKRRSIFPPAYNGEMIPKAVIEEIIENAHWAPNHKHTEPWRFKVLQGAALERLSTFMGDYYTQNVPEEKFSEIKLKKTKQKALNSSCVIAICMQRNEIVPEWEEIAAVACAVQNMWLTATAHQIGAYWSSTKSIKEAKELLDLEEGERCLGFFFMGYTDSPWPEGKRLSDWKEKTTWME